MLKVQKFTAQKNRLRIFLEIFRDRPVLERKNRTLCHKGEICSTYNKVRHICNP